jgi:purine-binding chemotaxis protein CheW
MSHLLFKLGTQYFRFPIGQVKDVLPIPSITKIPLANKEILGVFNLRGEIVTAIDLATILEKETLSPSMIIVTEFANDLYGLIVDKVDCITDSPDESITILHPDELLSKYFKTSAETY